LDIKQSVDGLKRFIVVVLFEIIILLIVIELVVFKVVIPELGTILSTLMVGIGSYLGVATYSEHMKSKNGKGQENTNVNEKK